ncbi:MAG: hypothetical protein FWC00_04650 [Firmicutes bacterium]|nr:hypothetical protein [Bacillota bacterium]
MNLLNLLLSAGGQDVMDVTTAAERIAGQVNTAVIIILAVIASVVALFAIYVGWKFATAKDDGARQNAKMQLIYSLIGAVSIGAIAGILGLVDMTTGVAHTVDETYFHGADDMLSTIGSAVAAVMQIIMSAAIIFAIYVGWQLMKAEDDGKRKEAKKQLIFTIIGVLAALAVATIVPNVLQQMVNQQAGVTPGGGNGDAPD